MDEAAAASRPDQAPAAPALCGRYLSITSYRRDGRGVATPAWFVQRDGRLLVETDAASGKVKRIRRNRQVRVAACTAGGRLRGEQVPAVTQILPSSEIAAVERLIARKYQFDMIIFRPPGSPRPGCTWAARGSGRRSWASRPADGLPPVTTLTTATPGGYRSRRPAGRPQAREVAAKQ